MSGLTGTLFVAIYLGVVFLATLLVFLALLRGLKNRAALPYKPIPIIFPPIPVEPGASVAVVGSLATIWSAAHLLVMASWLAVGFFVPQTAPVVIAGAYSSVAALLVGIGGVALLKRHPLGRNLISWGMVLFSLLAFYGLIICFLLPSLEDVSPDVRHLGPIIGTLVALHLAFDVVVGALGQRVGRPEGWTTEEALTEQPFPTGDVTMPDWDDPVQQH